MATERDRHNAIIVSGEPRGRILAGYIAAGQTPKPGTIMQIKAAVEPITGLYTFEVFNRTASGKRPQGATMILMEDSTQGKTIDDAYVAGARCQVYCPIPGDYVLCLLKDVAGTADARAIGDMYMVEEDSGKLIASTGTIESEPFVLMETLATGPLSGTGVSADMLALMEYTG